MVLPTYLGCFIRNLAALGHHNSLFHLLKNLHASKGRRARKKKREGTVEQGFLYRVVVLIFLAYLHGDYGLI